MKSLSNSFEYEAGKDVKPYYNNRIGINKSPTLLLSQMRKSFSSKQLSCSIQNKYETTKTEEVIMKRSLLNPESDHKILKNRAFSMQLKHAKLKKDKHDRLVNGSKSANLNRRLLNADIKKSR